MWQTSPPQPLDELLLEEQLAKSNAPAKKRKNKRFFML
jgi:hypothetical protein